MTDRHSVTPLSRRGRLRVALGALAVLCVFGATLAADEIHAAKRGKLVVTAKVKGGGKAQDGVLCAQRKLRYTGGKQCGQIRRGKAVLRPKAGRTFIRFYGGVADGVCFNKKTGIGFSNGDCTKVRVKAGKRKKLTWTIPPLG